MEPRRVLTKVVVSGFAVLLVCLASGCGREEAPPAAPTDSAQTPATKVVVPDVADLSAHEALSRLRSSGLDAYVSESRVTEETTGCPSARTTAAVTGTDPAVGMMLDFGDAVAVITGPSEPATDWAGVGHVEPIQQEGAAPCFECHEEWFCSDCHVREAAKN